MILFGGLILIERRKQKLRERRVYLVLINDLLF